MKSIAAQRDADLAELHALMSSSGTPEYSSGGVRATLYRPAGRATTVIDPLRFRGLVDEKDFYSTITVGVTKARALVPAKQLATVTTVVPGKPGEETVRIERVG